MDSSASPVTDFHDKHMPSCISSDMFERIQRFLPMPVLDYELNLLEPLTSVFAEFQEEYNKDKDFDTDRKLISLPDCN